MSLLERIYERRMMKKIRHKKMVFTGLVGNQKSKFNPINIKDEKLTWRRNSNGLEKVSFKNELLTGKVYGLPSMVSLSFEFNLSEGTFSNNVRSWYSNGQLREEIIQLGHRDQGFYTGWYENSEVMFESEFVFDDGLQIKTYFPNRGQSSKCSNIEKSIYSNLQSTRSAHFDFLGASWMNSEILKVNNISIVSLVGNPEQSVIQNSKIVCLNQNRCKNGDEADVTQSSQLGITEGTVLKERSFGAFFGKTNSSDTESDC